jgi:RNA polymerase nonessential primary-like sigma factor
VGDNQDTELSEMLEDESSSPDDYLDRELMRQDLIDLLGELNQLQREVIFFRFGLDGNKEMSLTKIGQRLNISRERVRQLENQALAHLRRKQAHIKEYLAG